MRAVQPIRDMEVLDKCFAIAREHDKNRKKGEVCWELLLLVGFNTSLRISDIRRFRVRDLRGKDYAEIIRMFDCKSYEIQEFEIVHEDAVSFQVHYLLKMEVLTTVYALPMRPSRAKKR